MFNTILTEFDAWAEEAKTADCVIVPHDYSGNISTSPFIKYMVVFGDTTRKSYDNNRQIKGMILLSIFYPSGRGQKVASQKASDLLYQFENRSPLPGLQTDLASLQFMGKDPSNKTLSRADLTIPFNFYGD